MAGHPDPERFVAEFYGSERTVAGYLMAEVLERWPADVRDLLLRTSILERVNGPLADSLTRRVGSEAILQDLEDANAFVVSLDAQRSWFRHHLLLADLLKLELRRRSPALIPSLHRQAAAWLEANGQEVAAIPHAQAAGDWARAARLLADNYVDLVFHGRKATLRARLAAFPAGAAEATQSSRWPSNGSCLRRSTRGVRGGHRAGRAAGGNSSVNGGGSSTSGWPARDCGSPASAEIFPPHARRCDRSIREPRMRWRAGTTIARRP